MYSCAVNRFDMQKAYETLGKPDWNQSLSMDLRKEVYLKAGVAFSMFQTRYIQG